MSLTEIGGVSKLRENVGQEVAASKLLKESNLKVKVATG